MKRFLIIISVFLSLSLVFETKAYCQETNTLNEGISAEDSSIAIAPTDWSFLIGTWVNIDLATGGIPAFIITKDPAGVGLTIQAFGACVPTWCDWGIVKCVPYAENVSATLAEAFTAFYDPGYAETIVTGVRLLIPRYEEYNFMTVNSFTVFKDGSARTDYYATDYFLRAD